MAYSTQAKSEVSLHKIVSVGLDSLLILLFGSCIPSSQLRHKSFSRDSRRDNLFMLFACFCPAVTKGRQDFGENSIVQIQVEMKGNEVAARHCW